MANKGSQDMRYDGIQLQWPNQKSADDKCSVKQKKKKRTVIRENWYARGKWNEICMGKSNRWPKGNQRKGDPIHLWHKGKGEETAHIPIIASYKGV